VDLALSYGNCVLLSYRDWHGNTDRGPNRISDRNRFSNSLLYDNRNTDCYWFWIRNCNSDSISNGNRYANGNWIRIPFRHVIFSRHTKSHRNMVGHCLWKCSRNSLLYSNRQPNAYEHTNGYGLILRNSSQHRNNDRIAESDSCCNPDIHCIPDCKPHCHCIHDRSCYRHGIADPNSIKVCDLHSYSNSYKHSFFYSHAHRQLQSDGDPILYPDADRFPDGGRYRIADTLRNTE